MDTLVRWKDGDITHFGRIAALHRGVVRVRPIGHFTRHVIRDFRPKDLEIRGDDGTWAVKAFKELNA